jgi:hypothetical protein
MIVLNELRKTYWAADFLCRLFSKAQKTLRNTRISKTADHAVRNPSQVAPDLTTHSKEPTAPQETNSDCMFLLDEFLSTGWNPFLSMSEDPNIK